MYIPVMFVKQHAATAYTLKLAEQIAMLSPDERRNCLVVKTTFVWYRFGKSASFDLSEDEIEELANLNVKRKTHLDSSFVEGSKWLTTLLVVFNQKDIQ